MRMRRLSTGLLQLAGAGAFALAPFVPASAAGGGFLCGSALSDAALAAALAPFDLPPDDSPRRDGACHAACLRSDKKAPPFRTLTA